MWGRYKTRNGLVRGSNVRSASFMQVSSLLPAVVSNLFIRELPVDSGKLSIMPTRENNNGVIGFKGPLNTVNNQRGHSPCRLRMRIFSCNCQQLLQASLAAVFVLGVTPSSCESLTAMPGRGSARKRSSASAARRGRGRGSRRSAAGPTTRQAANVTVTSSAAGSASSPVNSTPHFDLAQMLELVRAEVAAEFQAHQQIASGTPQQPRPQPATMQSAVVQQGVPQLDTSLPTQPAGQYGVPQRGTSLPTQPAVPPLAIPGI